jgi:hypothetical protein
MRLTPPRQPGPILRAPSSGGAPKAIRPPPMSVAALLFPAAMTRWNTSRAPCSNAARRRPFAEFLSWCASDIAHHFRAGRRQIGALVMLFCRFIHLSVRLCCSCMIGPPPDARTGFTDGSFSSGKRWLWRGRRAAENKRSLTVVTGQGVAVAPSLQWTDAGAAAMGRTLDRK